MSNALIPRATIYELESRRSRALALYGEAFDAIVAANDMHGQATVSAPRGPTLTTGSYGHARHYNANERETFLADMTKAVDRDLWSHLIGATDLERLMDKAERDAFRAELEKSPPPATAENCLATLERLIGDSGLIFRRGIANAFSGLDRRFRSHDGFKVGDRVVLSNAFSDGHWNYYRKHDETIRDVERAFYVLDGKEQPDRSGGMIGLVDQERRGSFSNSAFVVEGVYFRLKAFKNGNAHLWFTRPDLVEKVNLLLAEYYGDALGAAPDVADVKHSFAVTPAKNNGWFPTPADLAARVVEEARIGPGMTVLEPSAGEGALALLAQAAGGAVECCEIDGGRSVTLSRLGLNVWTRDFLELPVAVRPSGYDRVVMNPPFDRGRDIDHVTHALKFLKPGGRLVSIMSASTEFRQDDKAEAFRATVERFGGRFRDLPAGSFAPATNVNTCLCVIEAPR